MYKLMIKGITHDWTTWKTYKTFKSAETAKRIAIKAGRNPESIKIVKD